ncbi:MAG TPA: hypothetical protein QGG47_06630 [Acidobacteriota bacterium]|nr:hypothetical protein [Acidobacteriota bacterium]
MLMVGGVVMNSSIMLVNVDTDDVRIVVPVPLSLVQVALAFAPDEAKYVHVPEIGQYLPYVDRIVEELQAVPDALLVEVKDGSDHVKIFKHGDVLRVEVDERGDEMVRVSVPLAALAAMVDAYDTETETVRTSRLIGALKAAPSGELVHVIDDEEEVRIRMW